MSMPFLLLILLIYSSLDEFARSSNFDYAWSKEADNEEYPVDDGIVGNEPSSHDIQQTLEHLARSGNMRNSANWLRAPSPSVPPLNPGTNVGIEEKDGGGEEVEDEGEYENHEGQEDEDDGKNDGKNDVKKDAEKDDKMEEEMPKHEKNEIIDYGMEEEAGKGHEDKADGNDYRFEEEKEGMNGAASNGGEEDGQIEGKNKMQENGRKDDGMNGNDENVPMPIGVDDGDGREEGIGVQNGFENGPNGGEGIGQNAFENGQNERGEGIDQNTFGNGQNGMGNGEDLSPIHLPDGTQSKPEKQPMSPAAGKQPIVTGNGKMGNNPLEKIQNKKGKNRVKRQIDRGEFGPENINNEEGEYSMNEDGPEPYGFDESEREKRADEGENGPKIGESEGGNGMDNKEENGPTMDNKEENGPTMDETSTAANPQSEEEGEDPRDLPEPEESGSNEMAGSSTQMTPLDNFTDQVVETSSSSPTGGSGTEDEGVKLEENGATTQLPSPPIAENSNGLGEDGEEENKANGTIAEGNTLMPPTSTALSNEKTPQTGKDELGEDEEEDDEENGQKGTNPKPEENLENTQLPGAAGNETAISEEGMSTPKPSSIGDELGEDEPEENDEDRMESSTKMPPSSENTTQNIKLPPAANNSSMPTPLDDGPIAEGKKIGEDTTIPNIDGIGGNGTIPPPPSGKQSEELGDDEPESGEEEFTILPPAGNSTDSTIGGGIMENGTALAENTTQIPEGMVENTTQIPEELGEDEPENSNESDEGKATTQIPSPPISNSELGGLAGGNSTSPLPPIGKESEEIGDDEPESGEDGESSTILPPGNSTISTNEGGIMGNGTEANGNVTRMPEGGEELGDDMKEESGNESDEDKATTQIPSPPLNVGNGTIAKNTTQIPEELGEDMKDSDESDEGKATTQIPSPPTSDTELGELAGNMTSIAPGGDGKLGEFGDDVQESDDEDESTTSIPPESTGNSTANPINDEISPGLNPSKNSTEIDKGGEEFGEDEEENASDEEGTQISTPPIVNGTETMNGTTPLPPTSARKGGEEVGGDEEESDEDDEGKNGTEETTISSGSTLGGEMPGNGTSTTPNPIENLNDGKDESAKGTQIPSPIGTTTPLPPFGKGGEEVAEDEEENDEEGESSTPVPPGNSTISAIEGGIIGNDTTIAENTTRIPEEEGEDLKEDSDESDEGKATTQIPSPPTSDLGELAGNGTTISPGRHGKLGEVGDDEEEDESDESTTLPTPPIVGQTTNSTNPSVGGEEVGDDEEEDDDEATTQLPPPPTNTENSANEEGEKSLEVGGEGPENDGNTTGGVGGGPKGPKEEGGQNPKSDEGEGLLPEKNGPNGPMGPPNIRPGRPMGPPNGPPFVPGGQPNFIPGNDQAGGENGPGGPIFPPNGPGGQIPPPNGPGGQIQPPNGQGPTNSQEGQGDDQPNPNEANEISTTPSSLAEESEATTTTSISSPSADQRTSPSPSGPSLPIPSNGNGSSNNSIGPNCNGNPGQWSEWRETGPCTAECGACGMVQRTRECESFKHGKGCPCLGEYKVTEPCNIGVCQYPQPSCCMPYNLIYEEGKFACGPQTDEIIKRFLEESNGDLKSGPSHRTRLRDRVNPVLFFRRR